MVQTVMMLIDISDNGLSVSGSAALPLCPIYDQDNLFSKPIKRGYFA